MEALVFLDEEKGGEKTKEKVVVGMLITALLMSVFGIAFKIAPVHAQVVWSVPGNGTLFNVVTALAGPNDHIHVMAGWVEALPAPLNIWQNNLAIIGAPPAMGPTPIIQLTGTPIIITGTGVLIWGLNIVDIGPPTAVGIQLIPPSSNCIIWGNTITGVAPGTIGIQVLSNTNQIVLNQMSTWGICIDIADSTGNIVKGNIINPPYNIGIQVSGGAGLNQIYYNNLLGPPGLWDANPAGSPPNAFDDTFLSLMGAIVGPSGGPSLNKGNYEIAWANPAPYMIPPLTNGYMDFWPFAVPWVQLSGDINVDGADNIFDIVWVAVNFGDVWCTITWEPRCDTNGDGVIDIFDIVFVALNFGAIDP